MLSCCDLNDSSFCIGKYYIRSGSSSIEAKGYVLDELREMANRVPFDDRGNQEISINDISFPHVVDYFHKVGSKLSNNLTGDGLESVLEQMDLFVGPKENRMIKNVAAMMFCPNPEKFFPYTQVEIVIFPKGVFEDPRNFTEVPPIRGTVPQMIEETMRYLRTMVIKLHIMKQDSGPSKRIYNYPEKALEEALCNAFYHRDYRSRTPIVIEVQPYEITISSATGPDRSIPMDAIKKGQRMVSRYYRNRRLGEFLKELSLTEGRNTGIPTIQRELAHNGSPAATFETDEDRLSFLVRIPCHEGEEGVSPALFNDKEIHNSDKETENYDKEIRQRNLSDLQIELIKIVNLFPNITFNELAFKLNITVSALRNQRKQLESKGIFLCRKGATKKGIWEIKFD